MVLFSFTYFKIFPVISSLTRSFLNNKLLTFHHSLTTARQGRVLGNRARSAQLHSCRKGHLHARLGGFPVWKTTLQHIGKYREAVSQCGFLEFKSKKLATFAHPCNSSKLSPISSAGLFLILPRDHFWKWGETMAKSWLKNIKWLYENHWRQNSVRPPTCL